MITVYLESGFAAGSQVDLPDAAAQHVRVRRAKSGDPLRLLDGRGSVGRGTVFSVGKGGVVAAINDVIAVQRPSPLVALVPVADRDRMLFAAEKCVELGVTHWQPVMYERSRSVSPRGEGPKFGAKVRARMQSALEQSGGAWLPEVDAEIDAADAWRRVEASTRLLFHGGGVPPLRQVTTETVAFAVGPEGGFEDHEIDEAVRQGWVAVSLGPTTLRFETAIIAAAAVIRAMQL